MQESRLLIHRKLKLVMLEAVQGNHQLNEQGQQIAAGTGLREIVLPVKREKEALDGTMREAGEMSFLQVIEWI
ncbi:hypothetical protein D3C75_1331060 [compost metagenome]